MIPALVLMCRLSATECHSPDAQRIATVIDATTDHDGLRAHMVLYSHAESHWTINPRPWSWDARAGIAHGPWQLWGRPELTLEEQARAWLHNVEAAGLASVDSSPRRAARRAVRAARLLTE